MRGHWGMSASALATAFHAAAVAASTPVLLMLQCSRLWVTRDGNWQMVDRWYCFAVAVPAR